MLSARFPRTDSGEMSADTFKLLEFDELLSLLENYVRCPLGKGKLRSLAFLQDLEAVTARQQLAEQAREYLHSHAGPNRESRGASGGSVQQERRPGISRAPSLPERPAPAPPLDFSGLTDPGPVLSKAVLDGWTLEIPEILELLAFAEKASDIKRALLAVAGRFPRLAEPAARMGDFHFLLKQLRGKILPSGELDDHASPELKRIRREEEKQRALIHSSLRSFLRNQPDETPLQEQIITIRGERFVVPVRVERKGRIKGVMHGSSSSGQTVYVEPLETIDLNNELVRLMEQEQREIHRILTEMTAHFRRQAGELSETGDCLGVLDLAFACGRFAIDYDCVIPRFSPASGPARLVLKDARHPLLEALLRKKGAPVVPVSLAMKGEERVLVISGPNTGGKTVALKTVGLLALMAQAGLPVPAAEAEFPLFDRILADIGDYQSIQESLSTFSAHLLNISSMIGSVSRDSLVLLDEVGSATDPEEAGALGVAVVDSFRSAGAFAIVSTHHLSLKAYATNTAGVKNASMGFDEETLQPTYRLEMGWPGKSSGLAIAQRLGLQPEVLERARQALTSAHADVEELLAHLQGAEDDSIRLRAELEARQAELTRQEKEWQAMLRQREAERTRQWEQQLESLWQTFEAQAAQKLREAGAQAATHATGRSMKHARRRDPAKEAARMASRLRRQAAEELRQTVVSHLGGEGLASAGLTESKPEAQVGDQVKLKSLRKVGTVRNRTEDWLEVEIGRLRTRVPEEDVAEVIPAAAIEKTSAPQAISVRMETAATGSLSEINVIGETAEEARRRVDKFLDNAFLAQMSQVRIVHGSGKGILRKTLAEMFSEHPHVEKFSTAPQNEGGAGATIVELKV